MKYIYLGNWKREKKLLSLNHYTKLAVIDNESLTKRLTRDKTNNFRVVVQEQRLIHSKNVNQFDDHIQFCGMGVYRSVRLESKGFKSIYANTFFPIKSKCQ